MSCRLASLSRLLGAAVAALGLAAHAAAPHPMDPLNADEILAAANILLQGRRGAARRDLPEHRAARAGEGRGARRSAAAMRRAASATVFFRQNKQSFKSDRQPEPGQLHAAGADSAQRGPARPDDHRGQSTSASSFQDPAFLNALALRGISTPQQLQQVLVTPLTPGSFGLPEEQRRIVKAQMYYTDGASINLYARPIEGMQAIIDLDERRIVKLHRHRRRAGARRRRTSSTRPASVRCSACARR